MTRQAAARVSVFHLKAEVIHAGWSVKLLFAVHVAVNKTQGHGQPTTSNWATWVEAGYPAS